MAPCQHVAPHHLAVPTGAACAAAPSCMASGAKACGPRCRFFGFAGCFPVYLLLRSRCALPCHSSRHFEELRLRRRRGRWFPHNEQHRAAVVPLGRSIRSTFSSRGSRHGQGQASPPHGQGAGCQGQGRPAECWGRQGGPGRPQGRAGGACQIQVSGGRVGGLQQEIGRPGECKTQKQCRDSSSAVRTVRRPGKRRAGAAQRGRSLPAAAVAVAGRGCLSLTWNPAPLDTRRCHICGQQAPDLKTMQVGASAPRRVAGMQRRTCCASSCSAPAPHACRTGLPYPAADPPRRQAPQAALGAREVHQHARRGGGDHAGRRGARQHQEEVKRGVSGSPLVPARPSFQRRRPARLHGSGNAVGGHTPLPASPPKAALNFAARPWLRARAAAAASIHGKQCGNAVRCHCLCVLCKTRATASALGAPQRHGSAPALLWQPQPLPHPCFIATI